VLLIQVLREIFGKEPCVKCRYHLRLLAQWPPVGLHVDLLVCVPDNILVMCTTGRGGGFQGRGELLALPNFKHAWKTAISKLGINVGAKTAEAIGTKGDILVGLVR
jgi:hypothetical protein